jgi:hypothetical protein
MPVPHRVQLTSTPETEVGVYADFVAVWHQPSSFILDFLLYTRPPQLGQDETGNNVIDQTARLAARVRIPPAQVFEIMKALEQQLSMWERETGSPST